MHRPLIQGESIRVTGTVQGVGFRPCVWRLANECGIVGQVWNDAEGVMIHAWGSRQSREEFVQRLQLEQTPLAQIEKILRSEIHTNNQIPKKFQIVVSQEGNMCTNIVADAATCPECMTEVLDSTNRRYRYPFTNCTHCGPRLSIVNAIPYDRANTSMASFKMCAQCQAEYDDPTDRRFHAQPNACSVCGPKLWLEKKDGSKVNEENNKDVIETAAQLIQQGNIIAIKGIGGIQLACDASNEEVVKRLRQRKVRYQKAFALMARNVEMISCYAQANEKEVALLHNNAAPIVILNSKGQLLAEAVAPGQHTLGFMLPATPLHHLLMQTMTQPIVLTSGNRSDEPQTIDNQEAQQHLNQIADYYLLHDREIVNRLDDSVLRVVNNKPRFLRRARGYAPHPISLPEGFAQINHVFAMGAELKNTFCLLKENQAVLSQHIGDLEDALTFKDYHHNLELYLNLYDYQPSCIAVDKHPDYLSSKMGREWSHRENLQLVEVQHHHAHIAAGLAEHGMPIDTQAVLGIVLDGLGFGDDGTLWGGEFLLCDYINCKRLAHFQPVPMLGGTQAMLEPWRNTWAHLENAFTWEKTCEDYADLDLIKFLKSKPTNILKSMVNSGLNSPLASSCGRLFDAVAAATGICSDQVAYEGQAAMELESLAIVEFKKEVNNAYPFEFSTQKTGLIKWSSLWKALLRDLRLKVSPATIAARFHQGLVQAVVHVAQELCHQNNLDIVVLGGGVFQNRLLLEGISENLRRYNLKVFSPVKVPANDGGLSLGQAVVAAAKRAHY